jgi:hypothetical protein
MRLPPSQVKHALNVQDCQAFSRSCWWLWDAQIRPCTQWGLRAPSTGPALTLPSAHLFGTGAGKKNRAVAKRVLLRKRDAQTMLCRGVGSSAPAWKGGHVRDLHSLCISTPYSLTAKLLNTTRRCGGNGHVPVVITHVLRSVLALLPPAAARLPTRRDRSAETAAWSDTRGLSPPICSRVSPRLQCAWA